MHNAHTRADACAGWPSAGYCSHAPCLLPACSPACVAAKPASRAVQPALGPSSELPLLPPRLVQVVRRLPPEASAVKSIGQALYYFDSGALAALLKELNKSGHVRRAQEVGAAQPRAGQGHSSRTAGRRERRASLDGGHAMLARPPALAAWRARAGSGTVLMAPGRPRMLTPTFPSQPPPLPASACRSLTGCAAWTTATICTPCATR